MKMDIRRALSLELGIKGYFYVQKNAFDALGINIMKLEFNYRGFWKTCVTSAATILLLFAIGHYAFTHLYDVKLFIQSLSPGMQFGLLLGKVWLIVYNRKDHVQLVKKIQKMTLEASEQERKILIEENLRDTRLTRVYYWSVMATGVTAVSASWMKTIVVYIATGELKFITVFAGDYFLDYNIPKYYCIVLIWTMCAVYIGAFASISVDSLYSWYVYNMAAQFRILQVKLEQLPEIPREVDLINWIYSHQRRLVLAKELNRVYAPIVFIQFLLNSTQICFIAFQINGGVSFAELPFHMAFLFATMVQPTIYCLGGQRVESESDAIALAVYNSLQWKSWPMRLLKLMQFPILRARKSCKLTGIFFEVNLRLYLWVVRTAASYMTLLWSL